MIKALSGVIMDGTSPVTATQSQQVIEIPEGEYAELTVSVKGENGTVLPLAGYDVYLSVRRSSRTTPLFQRIASTIVSNQAKFVLITGDTESRKGSYLYDIFLVQPGPGSLFRVVPESRFEILDAMFDVDDDVNAVGPGVSLVAGCEPAIEVFLQVLRPSPGDAGETPVTPRMILNRTSNQIEISDGTNWYSPEGDII